MINILQKNYIFFNNTFNWLLTFFYIKKKKKIKNYSLIKYYTIIIRTILFYIVNIYFLYCKYLSKVIYTKEERHVIYTLI